MWQSVVTIICHHQIIGKEIGVGTIILCFSLWLWDSSVPTNKGFQKAFLIKKNVERAAIWAEADNLLLIV